MKILENIGRDINQGLLNENSPPDLEIQEIIEYFQNGLTHQSHQFIEVFYDQCFNKTPKECYQFLIALVGRTLGD